MSDNLRKNVDLLKLISSIKNPTLRKKILADSSSNDSLYNAIREIVKNLYNKNIKINNQQRKKLRKYDKTLKQFYKISKAKAKKKRLVIQSGGFLPILIPTAISLISEIIRNASR